MNKPAAIYARVSSDRQKENHTIGSQTSALVEYAQTHGYAVPSEWVFQDEGYSGASLVRPGLEALRDLAAQGQIVAALIYSPDRLSRKYAYQVLLSEELSRCGVDVIYLKSPSGDSPEDQLVVQFQGMIAEYERAQIAERHRRGKRHRAQQGMVNVLSGAPYGYRYVRKTDTSAAYYEVIESEADVVRMVFAIYTQQRFSINAIARLLNERGISTRTGKTRWERSTVWGLLRNPAYEGKACYGKTEQSERQRITRPLRQRNGSSHRSNCHRDRPRADWIEVTVPALVSEETFALAQERLSKNKHHSPRRTIEPTLLQGMLVCQQCGYALYRSSTRTSKRKLYYYRCLGSDAYRHFKGALCTNRPVRSDYLDQFVWDQIIGLLDNGMLVKAEIDRRKEAARHRHPRRQTRETWRREQPRYLLRSWSNCSTPIEHCTRRTRPGTGTAQASLRAVCGRLQYLRPKPTSGTAGDDERHALSHATAPAQGERGQECSGSTSRADVLWVQLQQQQGTEAAHRAESPVALQAENPGTDATDARNQTGTNAEGTDGLLKGLEELLRLLSDTLTAAATG